MNKIKCICNNCGKYFSVYPSRLKKHSCCSYECKLKYYENLKIKKHSKICDNCGKKFLSYKKNNFKNYCSQKCSIEHMRNENAYEYKNGMTIDVRGYRLIKIGHKKYQYEHRLVMEKYLGRRLKNNEVVHHIDENKLNNNITNLIILKKEDHDRYHTEKRHITERRFQKSSRSM